MQRTKEEFRALRETVGFTQATVAKLLDVRERSVRRWESTVEPHMPPDDAWDVLDEALDSQLYSVDDALSVLLSASEERSSVVLPYWTSQEDFEAHCADALFNTLRRCTTHTEANATVRALATLLRGREFEVSFVSGAQWKELFGD